jgi:hypothetical protein
MSNVAKGKALQKQAGEMLAKGNKLIATGDTPQTTTLPVYERTATPQISKANGKLHCPMSGKHFLRLKK